MEAFNAQLQLSCDGHMISDPAVSLVDGGVMRIEADKAKNGTTAAVVDTIITGKNLVRESNGNTFMIDDPLPDV